MSRLHISALDVKYCKDCDQTLPLSSFYITKKGVVYTYCRDCNRKRKRQWRLNNPDKVRVHKANTYARHRDKALAYQRGYMRTHPEVRRRVKAAYRARRRSSVFMILPRELDTLMRSACAECGSTDRITIDHIIPLSRGGRHSIGNLQALCHSCNSSKNDRLIVEWRKAKSRRSLACR